jgi:hypothetical protein
MRRPEQHNCLFCGAMFRADPRNARHQKYCSEAGCRKASKAASRRAWLAKPENQDYFRGAENVARVQSWRAAHPGYWRRPGGQRGTPPGAPLALQDLCPTQAGRLRACTGMCALVGECHLNIQTFLLVA